MGVVDFERVNLLKVVLIAAGALLAACLLVLAPTTERAKAAFPGKNGKIVFAQKQCDPRCEYEIYTVNPNGSGLTQLTNNKDKDEVRPAWSPDGKKIAFVRAIRRGATDIWVMNADGSNQTRLTKTAELDEGNPAWSPDGRKLVFFADSRTTNPNLYTVTISRPEDPPRQLTTSSAQDFDPAWSPDGKKIAFVSERDGDFDIFTMKAAPEGPENVPKNLTHDNNAREWAGNQDPDWSPNGKKIVFTSGRNGGNVEIYKMNADGTHPVRLTRTNSNVQDWWPVYSPNQAKIAFYKIKPFINSTDPSKYEINIMDSDGTDPVRLRQSEFPSTFGGLDWQPLP